MREKNTGNKEHLTFAFPLWFSHDGPKCSNTSKKPPKSPHSQKASKVPSLLSAHAGISSLFSLFEKCVPLLHETTLFCKNTESRTRGYVNNSRNLPTSRTQRTQGRNIPFEGTPHSDIYTHLICSRVCVFLRVLL